MIFITFKRTFLNITNLHHVALNYLNKYLLELLKSNNVSYFNYEIIYSILDGYNQKERRSEKVKKKIFSIPKKGIKEDLLFSQLLNAYFQKIFGGFQMYLISTLKKSLIE